VEDQFRGAAVQCGGCARQFTVPASSASWWGGLRRVYQSLTGSGNLHSVEDPSLSLVLDGPAAQLAEREKPETVAITAPHFEVGAATSAGPVRRLNEDSFLSLQWNSCNRDQPGGVAILAVADGMGGHAAGDLASGLVVRTLATSLGGLLLRLGMPDSGQPIPTPAEVAVTLGEAIQSANRMTHQKGLAEAGCQGMGAALAAVVAWQNQAVVAHVGDCRVYHFRAGNLVQLTRDHTVVARMVELGKLSPAEAQRHPARNELTQAMGRYPQVEPSSLPVSLATGDWLIAACDGLQAHVDDAALAGLLAGAANAVQLAHDLVALANQKGGSDNCTVLALHCRA
jgi:protein phosphatase